MFKGIDAFLVCYDVTNSESFFAISSYYKRLLTYISQFNGKKKMFPTIIVGCKNDMAEKRAVDFQDGERTAEAY